MDGFAISRRRMLREQLVPRGITSRLVLDAMQQVPRHRFVEEALYAKAYEDYPLPIACGQTISQPFVVAIMSQLLHAAPGMSVLEIGTGSGYQAAVLATMGLDVYSVERQRSLYQQTSRLLMDLRYHRIHLKLADGTLGWVESAPFDRIIVTAGGPEIPQPLLEQLSTPGIMVIPVGSGKRNQELILIRKGQDGYTYESYGSVAFVDLVGNYGWDR